MREPVTGREKKWVGLKTLQQHLRMEVQSFGTQVAIRISGLHLLISIVRRGTKDKAEAFELEDTRWCQYAWGEGTNR